MTIVTVLRNAGSRSARRLAEALGVGLATSGRHRSTEADRFVINWGVSREQANFRQRRLTYSNEPASVANCADKILTFQKLREGNVPCLDWVTEEAIELATAVDGNPNDDLALKRWLEEDGKIVARMTTTGHSGRGIRIVRQEQPIPDAPLYTRYFRKQAEYRVHMFYGVAILIQQKKKMGDADERVLPPNASLVRTHANGWVFAVNDLACDAKHYRERLVELAIRAAAAVGANHCAVDILVKHPANRPMRDWDMVVCEINSAPALEADSTLNAYVEAFRTKLGEM